jgi:hypothetical protein
MLYAQFVFSFPPSFIENERGRERKNRAQIEFLARSTRNSLIVLHIIYVVKFRYRARFTRAHTHTNRLSTAVKFREKTKAHPDERKKKLEEKIVNEGGDVCYDSSLFSLLLFFDYSSCS